MPPIRPMSDEELQWIKEHPGFDREFFERWLTEITSEYAQHRGLDETTMVVNVRLHSGEEFAVTSARSALTWIVFFTEEDGMRFVPLREVVSIVVDRRPDEAPLEPVREPERRQIGFTVERINEEVRQ
jgi:hypothetical protein